MYKKLLISLSILIAIIFSFTVCLANDNNMFQNAANGVRNVVGGAENAVENTAKDVSNTSKEATNKIENGANNTKNTVTDHNKTATTNTYTATRTATDGTAHTFMGMSSTAWTWLIIGIAAIVIVALVWYYAAQTRSSNYNDKD